MESKQSKVSCTGCQKPLTQENPPQAENKVYKCGELNYIELFCTESCKARSYPRGTNEFTGRANPAPLWDDLTADEQAEQDRMAADAERFDQLNQY